MSIFKDQFNFMITAGQVVLYKIKPLYEKLVHEEYKEWDELTVFDDKVSTEDVKETVDLIVVATGYLISLLGSAEKAQKAWDLVHATNMAKAEAGQKRDDGKVIQHDEYKKVLKAKLMADLRELMNE